MGFGASNTYGSITNNKQLCNIKLVEAGRIKLYHTIPLFTCLNKDVLSQLNSIVQCVPTRRFSMVKLDSIITEISQCFTCGRIMVPDATNINGLQKFGNIARYYTV